MKADIPAGLVAFGVSEAEYMVLRLTVDGFSVPQIADVLNVSQDSVRRATSNVTGKLGASHKAQMIYMLTKRGLLWPATPAAPA